MFGVFQDFLYRIKLILKKLLKFFVYLFGKFVKEFFLVLFLNFGEFLTKLKHIFSTGVKNFV